MSTLSDMIVRSIKSAGSYTGDMVAGVRHGKGRQQLEDGSVHSGYWNENKLCGQGMVTFANGDVYVGAFDEDMYNGYGVYKYANGDVCEGHFLNNKPHGQGVCKFVNGNIFEGTFEEACNLAGGLGKTSFGSGFQIVRLPFKRNGHGSEERPLDNEFYEGDWLNDRKNVGEFINEGGIYKGSFVNDQFNGHGVFQTHDGQVYDGEWLDGMKHGQGAFIDPFGNVHEGTFAFNYEHGPGVFTFDNGDVIEGNWAEGEREGDFVFKFNDGDVFVCKNLNDMIHGPVRYVCANGDAVSGEYREDAPIGFATVALKQRGLTHTFLWPNTNPDSSFQDHVEAALEFSRHSTGLTVGLHFVRAM